MIKYKVFMGFSEVAGYNSNLQKGFDALGIKSSLMTFGKHRFQYDTDKNQSFLTKYIQFVVNQHMNKSYFRVFTLLHLVNKFFLFIWAIMNYNVFIFSHFGTFFNFIELPILKLLNKKVIFVFFGSDIRPPYINGGYFFDEGNNYDLVENLSRNISSNASKIIKYADYIVNATSTSHLINKKQIDFVQIGFPMELSIANKENGSSAVKILHAPSLRKQKGSDAISQMIEELKEEGYNIKYTEIHGMCNAEVIEQLQLCDFIVDEMYSDVPMAGFSTEAAYCGKPAIIGGYYTNMHKEINMKELPPSHYVDPSSIKDAIRKLVEDTQYRLQLGERAKKFITTHNSIENVAKRYLKLMDDNPEPQWIFDPMDITYINGWGTSKSRLKEFLKGYVKNKGEKALYLEHSPIIKKRFLDFINE